MSAARGPAPVLAALLLVFAALVACSSGSGAGSSSTESKPSSATGAVLPGGEGETSTSSTKAPVATSPRKSTAAPRKSTAAPKPAGKVREVNHACPYISNQNEAIAEGKAVGRSTVLTTAPATTSPAAASSRAMTVGCKFYLAYPDYHVVTEITVRTYPTELAAFNTVARTGGSTAQSTPGIGDGAVLYRMAFYKPDGNQDWSCIFAKGTTVVTIHTDELHSSVDARNVAAAIVDKF